MIGPGHFTDDFKRDAVAQITERCCPVAEVSWRLGVSRHSLYVWKRKFSKPSAPAGVNQAAEIRRLKVELARVTEERDILKKSHCVFRQGCKVRYAFVAEHRQHFPARTMCRCLRIQTSGFYALAEDPLSRRAGRMRARSSFSTRSVKIAATSMATASRMTTCSIRVRPVAPTVSPASPGCGDQGSDRLSMPAGLSWRQAVSRDRQHPGPRVRCRRAGQGVGDGHHPHQNPSGFRLSGRGHRPVLPPRHWLVASEPVARRRRAAGVADGGVATEAGDHGPGPLGSGLTFHQHGLG